MRVDASVRILLPVTFVICSCASISVQSPAADQRIVLAAEKSACQTSTTHSQWYALFGALPLNKVDLPLAPGSTYRMREMRTPLDYAVTVLGGTFLTITRKSILLETCAETYAAYSPEDLAKKREAEIRTVLDTVLKESGQKGQPAFLMKDGSVHRGRIAEISDSAIVLISANTAKEESETRKPDDGAQVRIARVLLVDGRTISGEITSQTPRSITLRSSSGTVTLEKTKIRRISYSSEPAPVREERITLARADILRILLPEDKP